MSHVMDEYHQCSSHRAVGSAHAWIQGLSSSAKMHNKIMTFLES